MQAALNKLRKRRQLVELEQKILAGPQSPSPEAKRHAGAATPLSPGSESNDDDEADLYFPRRRSLVQLALHTDDELKQLVDSVRKIQEIMGTRAAQSRRNSVDGEPMEDKRQNKKPMQNVHVMLKKKMIRAAAAELEDFKLKMKKRKQNRNELEKPSIDEIWEIATALDGNISAHLWVTDFVDLFMLCKQAGMDMKLAHFPGLWPAFDHEPEDMAPGEVTHLCAMLINDTEDELTLLQVRTELHEVHEIARYTDYKDIAICKDSCLTRKHWRSLIRYIGDFMCIDEEYVISSFLWAGAGVFEMSDKLAALVITLCARKRRYGKNVKFLHLEEVVGKDVNTILNDPFTQNDFNRMAYRCEVVDARQRNGLPHSKLSEVFLGTTKRMERLLKERCEKRPSLRKVAKAKEEEKPKEEQPFTLAARKEYITRGRTEFSILLEELFKAMPKGLFASPLQMCLKFLDRIKQKEGLGNVTFKRRQGIRGIEGSDKLKDLKVPEQLLAPAPGKKKTRARKAETKVERKVEGKDEDKDEDKDGDKDEDNDEGDTSSDSSPTSTESESSGPSLHASPSKKDINVRFDLPFKD